MKIKLITIYRLNGLLLLLPTLALAGAPFITDDPDVIDYRQWQFYLYSTFIDSSQSATMQLPALEINYGIAPNVQLHVATPTAFNFPKDDTENAFGLNDTELGVEFRFIQETAHCPQLALFPAIELPTGDAQQDLGNGQTWEKLPIWVQKSWNSWTVFGGGGYVFNTAPGMRTYPFAGAVLQRDVNKFITSGAELYTQARSADDKSAYTLLNFGEYFNFTKHFNLLLSAGHSILGQHNFVTYLGFVWLTDGMATSVLNLDRIRKN